MMIDFLSIMIIILFIALLIIYKVNRKTNIYIDKSEQTIIPKKIWTYWHDESQPDIIKRCIENWKKLNPDYEITILNNSNYKEYIKGL